MGLKLISPHRDDAAFSCGILLSLCASMNLEVQVVNVFTYSDYAPFAERSSADRVSELRKGEDLNLQGLVGSSLNFLDLGLLDAPLRLQIRPEQTLKDPIEQSIYLREVDDLEKVLRPILTEADGCVLVPMAIGGHIDHQITRDAALRCIPLGNLAFYEDLPYAAHMDVERRAKVLTEFQHFDKLQAITLRSSNGAARKQAFASCYPSQVAASTVAEIVTYAEGLGGGEKFYAGSEAVHLLGQVQSWGRGPVAR